METKELLQEVKDEITPSEDIQQHVEPVLSKIQEALDKNDITATAIIGGSVAKETFLKGDHDCDVFVKFDLSYKDRDLSDLLEPILAEALGDVERLHGSRDYFQHENDFNFEIVPVLDISMPKEAENITDCSPLHVEWVRKHGKQGEIRLAKAFAKAQHIYGAESYIRGFSGHVIDILTIHYGSFMDLLTASQQWNEGEVIDPENRYGDDAKDHLNEAKLMSPLIVIDPIQPERNAAAALGNEAFTTFKEKAKAFLNTPSREFFVKHSPTVEELKEKSDVILRATPKEGKRDVVGAKLMKAFEFLCREAEEYGFALKDASWQWDGEAYMWFSADNIAEEHIREGPPLHAKENVDRFKEKYKNTYNEDNRIMARVKREHTTLKSFLSSLLGHDYINTKVNSIEVIE